MKGIYSALLVPFDEKGKILERGLRQVVRQNVERQKVDGLYVNGSTGENFMLSTGQKKRIFSIVKDESGDAIDLIAQVGSIDLNEAVDLARYATDLGYNCLSAVTPFYYRFGFDEIKDYYETLVDESGNDLLIYAIPALTGVNISMPQYDELFRHEHITGVKYTDPDFYRLERLRRRHPEKYIMYGLDEMLIHGIVAGADGAIGSTYNVNGVRAARIMRLVRENRIAEAYELQHTTNDLIEKLLGLGIYQALKEILREKGVEAGQCKRPMRTFDLAKVGEIQALVRDFGL